jgi:hypothetical protein
MTTKTETMLIPDELLLDRFKVATTWPDMSNYEMYQGQIIKLVKLNSGGFGHPTKGNTFYKSFFENYPHLFQPLPWYADRKQEDMPAFIKCDERVWKITEWKKDIVGRFFPMNEIDAEGESENFANIKWHFCAEKFLPCTSEEYNEWKQSNK